MNLINVNSIKYENYFNSVWSSIDQYKAINQPLGSMPLDANSLRIILFIQPDRLSSPSCFCAISIASRNAGSSLNWNAGLPRLDKFFSFCIDTSHTPIYYIYVYIHNTYFFIKEQGFKCAATQVKPLTNNLTKDKTMANLNYTGFTYIFIGILRTDLSNQLHKLRIPAESELQARKQLARDYVLVFAGKIPVKTEEGLSIAGNRCSIQGTTTKDANRKRYSSGIFLSQIPFKSRLSKFGLVSFIEFAIRATLRTKAHLRTNKGGSSLAVVEPLSHLTSDNLLTKTKERNPTMKTSQKSTALLAVRSRTPIIFTPTMEVAYA
ncbi:host cell division inhibitor Icd-like protein [Pasteurella multocida]|uniref:host cell division inhibitor Icd-like protein n=1 Tax=Pasteurella multocida TaxID=747 RepID=UPI001E6198CD|nr:host cell division inhibitor Icd-like protein [Pasteurella multocida]